MNKVTQSLKMYIWIIDTIRRFQPVSFEQIDKLWRCSTLSEGDPLDRKSFRRALDSLEETLGVSIECSGGRSATYRIADKGALRGNSLQRWMLSTLSVAGAVSEARQLQGRVLLENVPSGDLLLTEVTRAMENGHTLQVSYQKFIDSEPYETELEPYCIKLFRQRWYLLAHRPGRDYLAIYAMDRMQHCTETVRPFVLPADFNAEQHFHHLFGVFQPAQDAHPQLIRLRTYNGEWNYLRTLPLHASQKEEEPCDNDHVDFTLYLHPTLDFKLELLARAINIEVLEPQSLRQDLAEMLRKGLAHNS